MVININAIDSCNFIIILVSYLNLIELPYCDLLELSIFHWSYLFFITHVFLLLIKGNIYAHR